jgi:hypothetical protein
MVNIPCLAAFGAYTALPVMGNLSLLKALRTLLAVFRPTVETKPT